MNRIGMGMGSALLTLVFTVLCLTIFALLSLSIANAEVARANAETQIVKGYYEADLYAECILAEILEADDVPDVIQGVSITVGHNRGTKTVMFSCPISDQKELYVEIALSEHSCDILKWHMRDTDVWNQDESLPVWPGG